MNIQVNNTTRAMTTQELADYNARNQADTLDAARRTANVRMTDDFNAAALQGCAITGRSWRLSPADAELIAQDVTLIGLQLDIADDAGKAAILAGNIAIPTTQGPQTVTVSQARVFYATFGTWMRALVLRLKTAQTAIASANTVEAVNAITF